MAVINKEYRYRLAQKESDQDYDNKAKLATLILVVWMSFQLYLLVKSQFSRIALGMIKRLMYAKFFSPHFLTNKVVVRDMRAIPGMERSRLISRRNTRNDELFWHLIRIILRTSFILQ